MSCTEFLCKTLKPPVYHVYRPRPGSGKKLAVFYGEETPMMGRRHGTLKESFKYLEKAKVNFNKIKKVIAVVRNPYDYELSLWNYYNLMVGKGKMTEKSRVESVQKGDFKNFVKQNFLHRPGVKIEDFVKMRGTVHPKVQLIKLEELSTDLNKLIEEFGRPEVNIKLPHKNKSKKKAGFEDYDAEMIGLINKKYKWLFDMGLYEMIPAE